MLRSLQGLQHVTSQETEMSTASMVKPAQASTHGCSVHTQTRVCTSCPSSLVGLWDCDFLPVHCCHRLLPPLFFPGLISSINTAGSWPCTSDPTLPKTPVTKTKGNFISFKRSTKEVLKLYNCLSFGRLKATVWTSYRRWFLTARRSMKSHTNRREGWGPMSAPSANEFVDLPSGMLVWLTDGPWVSKWPRFEGQVEGRNAPQ